MDKKSLLIFLFIGSVPFLAPKSYGQAGLIPGTSDPSKADLQVLTQNRSLVSTTISPTEGRAEIYLVGTQEGSVDVDDLKLFLASIREKERSKLEINPAPASPRYVRYQPTPSKVIVQKKKRVKKRKSKSAALQARN